MIGIGCGMGFVRHTAYSISVDRSPAVPKPVPVGTEYLRVSELSIEMARPGGFTSRARKA